MNAKFIVSKRISNIIEFDRTNQQIRFLDDHMIIPYDELLRVRTSLDYVDSATKNMIANMGRVGAGVAFTSGSENVLVRIKLFLKNDQTIYKVISKKESQKNSLAYHTDIKEAEKIVNNLNTIIKRRTSIEPDDFIFKISIKGKDKIKM